ncbi:DUF2207 family protein [Candidatus Leptofilum sp.]|uniref:DUF2207 family protein n=1 Tax=Candidatus Leptofilum sp. TaxID=3241576 RepID=UPI003B5CD48F
MKRFFAFFLLIWTLSWFVPPGQNAAAQTAVQYERYDVNITILPDGRFTVQEIQYIRFGGEFTQGFAEIPLAFTTGIEDVKVTGGPSLEAQELYLPGSGAAQTFTQSREGDSLFVDWEFAPTSPGDTLLFVLEYTVQGGLWVYPEATRLEWRAVPADRSGIAVPQSQVTVQLPAAVPATALTADAFGSEFDLKIVENAASTSVIYQSAGEIADGTQFQVLLDFPPDAVTAVPQAWQIAEDSTNLEYCIDQIDLQITMQPDGTLNVLETQQVSVQAGILYQGYRHFSLLFTDGIQILGVREGDLTLTEVAAGNDCLDCYTVETQAPFSWWASYDPVDDEVEINEEAAGEVLLNWYVPPLVAGESSQFTIEYLVEGAILPGEGEQYLNWTAVSNYDVPIENVAVTWVLPNSLGLEDATFAGGDVSRAADGAILLTNSETVAPNTPWQIELTLPPNAVDAAVPAWQEKIEAEVTEGIAYRERQARLDLARLVGTIFAGVLAVLGGITYWFLQGSRRLREARGNYRTEPPSDLPPGVVNYLVEGKMTARGVLASVLHLADLGLLRLKMGEPLELTAVRQEPLHENSKITTPAGEEVSVSRFLAQLFNHLLPLLPEGKSVPLPTLLLTLPSKLPELTKTMGEEMVGYFYGRNGWRAKYGQSLTFIAMIAIFAVLGLGFMSGVYARWNVPVPIIMFGGILLWMFVSIRLSRKTRPLTEQAKKEAQKWQGFKLYLSEIQQFGNLAEAQEILDNYFAYAVALGVDERLLAQIEALGGKMPSWLGDGSQPRPVRRRTWQHRWRRRWQRGSWRPQPPRPATAVPTSSSLPNMGSGNGRPPLESLSDSLAGGLERSSDRLATVLNTAVRGKDGDTPNIVLNAAGQSVKLDWDGEQTVDGMMNDIMRKAQTIKPVRPSSGGGRGGYRGGSRSSFGRSSSRSSRSRSSSSRRSGGGGSRGFR